jgi:hypothetical protein
MRRPAERRPAVDLVAQREVGAVVEEEPRRLLLVADHGEVEPGHPQVGADVGIDASPKQVHRYSGSTVVTR